MFILVAAVDAPAVTIARAHYVCDGVADNVQILAAYDDAVRTGASVLLVGSFVTAVELVFPAGWTNPVVNGAGMSYVGSRTSITPSTTMRSVHRFNKQYSRVSDIKFSGASLADYCLFVDGARESTFTRLATGSSKYDGIHISRTINFAEYTAAFDGTHLDANNNAIVWDNCLATDHGTLYATTGILGQYSGIMRTATAAGTVSTTSGSNTITGSGTTFTGKGFRKGDILRVGATAATAQYLQIESIDSATQITTTIWRPATTTVSGSASWAIGAGDGYHEERSLDSNLAMIRGGFYSNNAGCAFRLCGLYGATLDTVQAVYSGSYGIAIGIGDNDGQVRYTRLNGPYLEGNVASAPILAAMAFGLTVNQPIWAGAASRIHLGLGSQNLGVIIDETGVVALVSA